MASICEEAADTLMDFLFNQVVPSAPADLYLGLSTADPLGDGTGLSEPSGGSYARVIVDTKFALSVAGVVDSDTLIEFPEATALWGTMTHWFLADHLTLGTTHILCRGPLGTAKLVTIGDTPRFDVGDLTVTMET